MTEDEYWEKTHKVGELLAELYRENVRVHNEAWSQDYSLAYSYGIAQVRWNDMQNTWMHFCSAMGDLRRKTMPRADLQKSEST